MDPQNTRSTKPHEWQIGTETFQFYPPPSSNIAASVQSLTTTDTSSEPLHSIFYTPPPDTKDSKQQQTLRFSPFTTTKPSSSVIDVNRSKPPQDTKKQIISADAPSQPAEDEMGGDAEITHGPVTTPSSLNMLDKLLETFFNHLANKQPQLSTLLADDITITPVPVLDIKDVIQMELKLIPGGNEIWNFSKEIEGHLNAKPGVFWDIVVPKYEVTSTQQRQFHILKASEVLMPATKKRLINIRDRLKRSLRENQNPSIQATVLNVFKQQNEELSSTPSPSFISTHPIQWVVRNEWFLQELPNLSNSFNNIPINTDKATYIANVIVISLLQKIVEGGETTYIQTSIPVSDLAIKTKIHQLQKTHIQNIIRDSIQTIGKMISTIVQSTMFAAICASHRLIKETFIEEKFSPVPTLDTLIKTATYNCTFAQLVVTRYRLSNAENSHYARENTKRRLDVKMAKLVESIENIKGGSSALPTPPDNQKSILASF